MKAHIQLLLIIITLLATAYPATGELLPFATITGQVTDTNGASIAYPSVIAVAGNDTLGAYMSNMTGKYRIDLSFPVPTGIEEDVPASIPVELLQNYPNPFNPSTTIAFELSEPGDVSLTVYSISGQKVATLYGGRASSGMHRVVWNGCDDYGRHVGSGVYLYRLVANGTAQTRKMLLLDSGMVPSGGAPVSAYHDKQVTAVSKPASVTCDIIASKEGYESVTIPGVVVPIGSESITQQITLTRRDTVGKRLPLEVGASWEFVELEADTGSYGSRIIQGITYHTFEIIGTREVDGLMYYEFDAWPVFVPEEYHDPEQPPLVRSNIATGAFYFRYNDEDMLLIPPYDPEDDLRDIVLDDGPVRYYTLSHSEMQDPPIVAYNRIFSCCASSSYWADRYYMNRNRHLYYFNEQYGLVSFTIGYLSDVRTFVLKRIKAPDHLIDLEPEITPVDGIQQEDAAYLIRLAVNNSMSNVLNFSRPVWLATKGIDDPSLIPEFPFLRFHLTSAIDVDALADENQVIIGLNMLNYTQRADSTIMVDLAYTTRAYKGAPPLSGGGYGEMYIFYPHEDTWGWEVYPWFAD